MFNRGKQTGSSRAPMDPAFTILGEGTHWQGEIRAGASGLRVEGVLEGTILSEGQVVVAPNGVVRGTIHAKRLTVTGRVEGVFKVSGCLEILGTGWVEGQVEIGSLVVDEGGTLLGTCQQQEQAGPKSAEPVPFVPRRDERVQERFAPVGTVSSGTHGPLPEFIPVGRSFDRGKS
jgi:cytoskeletal protein CcmA (bactofilin family)